MESHPKDRKLVLSWHFPWQFDDMISGGEAFGHRLPSGGGHIVVALRIIRCDPEATSPGQRRVRARRGKVGDGNPSGIPLDIRRISSETQDDDSGSVVCLQHDITVVSVKFVNCNLSMVILYGAFLSHGVSPVFTMFVSILPIYRDPTTPKGDHTLLMEGLFNTKNHK